MPGTTIAIVADCDDTLAPDTTAQLLKLCGVDPDDFFQCQTAPLVEEGWDPTLAYMNRMVELSKNDGPLSALSEEKIVELGSQLCFYPGVPEFFGDIKTKIEGEEAFRGAGIRVESYVISGGIAELLRASPLQNGPHQIWGCSFSYDDKGIIAFPKNVISFTEKTRFLFRINKGLVRPDDNKRPFGVNTPMREEERPVPFSHMIYLGDGATDIPCMSMLQSEGGFVIGVASKQNPARTWALAYGRRAHQTVDPDFRPGGSAYRALYEAVRQKAAAIAGQTRSNGPIPQF